MSFCALLLIASYLSDQTGEFVIHMILHAVGHERYQVIRTANDVTLKTTIEYTDRANVRKTSATLRMTDNYSPLELLVEGKPESVKVNGTSVTVRQNDSTRTFTPPERYFAAFGLSPFAIQSMMFRYWSRHGKPAELPILSSSERAEPVQINQVGRDEIDLNGKHARLDRYTVGNLAFGREILWADGEGDVVAVMTFAGGLPMEAVRTDYEPAFSQLYRSAVAQQIEDLKTLAREVPPLRAGTFAISGAKLVDATGAPAIADSTVLVRNGRIAAVGTAASVHIPRDTPIVDAKGQTLLPGLWEMHIHASGVEFGPALLAAGITTARDCGGEFEYLVAQRNASLKENVPSPRMLLAGLVDAGGINAFGAVTAETLEEGRAVVQRYHAAGFEQIKLYTYLTPGVIKAISAEAHHLGMTVTGHVPKAVTTAEGIADGMDQINHLNYVSTMLRGSSEPNSTIDLTSPTARNAIEFLRSHHTVVDPTIGWGEMASHSKQVDVAVLRAGHLARAFRSRRKVQRNGIWDAKRDGNERANGSKPEIGRSSPRSRHTDRPRKRHRPTRVWSPART